MACKSSNQLEKEVLERSYNLVSKMLRLPAAAPALAKMKNMVFKTILYMNKEFGEELQMNALRTLHPLCKVQDFRTICYDEHGFPPAVFNGYVKEIQLLFTKAIGTDGKEDAQGLVNTCGSMVAFLGAFPERLREFEPIIKDLITIVKEKTELVRKQAAILLAKLAADEELNKVIRGNHGFDVLMSLRGAI